MTGLLTGPSSDTFEGRLQRFVRLPPVALLGAAVYAASIESYQWTTALATATVVGLALADVAILVRRRIPVVDHRSLRAVLLSLVLTWLILVAQTFVPWWLVVGGSESFTDVAFEAVSIVTTTGFHGFTADLPQQSPGIVVGAMSAAFGGYLSIITSYTLIRYAIAGLSHSRSGSEPGTPEAEQAGDDDDLDSISAVGTNTVSINDDALWRWLPSAYMLAIFAVAGALGLDGRPLLQALTWACHAVATAGPFPGHDSGFVVLSPTASTSLILFGGMILGSVVLPLIALVRIIPQVLAASGAIWIAVVVIAATFGGAPVDSSVDATWVDRLLTSAAIGLTGPVTAPPAVMLLMPALILAAFGALPASTGGGVRVTNVRALFAWLWHGVARLASRPWQYRATDYHVVALHAVPTRNPIALGFIAACWAAVVMLTTVAVGLGGADFVFAIETAVAAVSNTGALLTVVPAEGGIGDAAFSAVAKWFLIFAMLAGRIELLLPALVIVFQIAGSSMRPRQSEAS